MIVAYCFCPQDEDLALKNAQWMSELGGCRGHDVFMLYDRRCRKANEIEEELRKSFDHIRVMQAGADIDGWPQGANYFFRTIAGFLQSHNGPFLWLEPDAIPLKEGWLTGIEHEYEKVALTLGKVFMGDRVQVENIPLHMSGVGVYPNPLHAYAGEAYRAHDLAWDMAGKDQIVPKTHFTKLIEHAWKHPSFTDLSELQSQIRPEAVLFHSSKDGSLIDLLQSKQRGKQSSMLPDAQAQKEPEEPGSPSLSNFSGSAFSSKDDGDKRRMAATAEEGTAPKPVQVNAEASVGRSNSGNAKYDAPLATAPGRTESSMVQASSSAITCDIFIRTYPNDYEWLAYCLRSIDTYCTGFRKVTIVSPKEAPAWFDIRANHWAGQFPMEWKVMNEETQDGYLAQQIHKLYADVITDYQADYILHLDSDTLFTRPVTPSTFLDDGKIVWLYTDYSTIQTPWNPITEKFMGDEVRFEFMRRFPIMVPRWLYPKLREFCYQKHNMIISDYIRMQPHRDFSEFNALGAFAWKFHNDKFAWWNTEVTPLPEPMARQFFSWGGITDEVKKEIASILGNETTQPQSVSSNGEITVTIADEIRYHTGRLAELCREKPSRRQAVVAELRKQKLVPKKFR